MNKVKLRVTPSGVILQIDGTDRFVFLVDEITIEREDGEIPLEQLL